ncbi:murein biosynthesis integral membrane protein MurJ [Paenibacillus sp. LjRoot56]|uniref:murein biosynthesis integral membrane protein MurJ n=1 Tax=Paenibacillus sp. LjRoot56 TaxID=3342333 RepID=UPI003ECD349B
MKKVTIIIVLLSLLSKIIGFGREITLSYFYGASHISDAYLISLTIPGTIFTFVGVGITTSFIPMYSSISKRSNKEADNYTSNLINLTLIISILICVLVLLFTVPIVKLFASGFDNETLNLAVYFTRISVIGILFSGATYILTGYLNMKRSLLMPILTGVPFNLIIIASIALSSKFDIAILSIGMVTAMGFQLIILLPLVYKKGYKYKHMLDLKDENVKQMSLLALPVIFGTSVDQINKLINRTIASHIEVGGISALNYGNRLVSFVQGIFVTSIVSVMYPAISKLSAENNMNGLKKSLSDAISSVNLLVVPSTVFSIIFAEPIIRILFGRGQFGPDAVSMTSNVLLFYSIGLIGVALREVISKVFYAMHDTRTPMINAAVSVAIDIGLNLILSRYMGIAGLALSTSISAIFCTMLLFISLSKKIGAFGLKGLFISFGKIVIASMSMGILSRLVFSFLTNIINLNISLLISAGVAAIVYLILIYMLKVEDAFNVVNTIKNKWLKNGKAV